MHGNSCTQILNAFTLNHHMVYKLMESLRESTPITSWKASSHHILNIISSEEEFNSNLFCSCGGNNILIHMIIAICTVEHCVLVKCIRTCTHTVG